MPSIPSLIDSPGGFVPQYAVAFGSPGATAVAVDLATPLPVVATTAPARSVALGGTTVISGTFGPFAPQLGRALWLTLAGTWTGNVQLLRSTDGGTTKAPLTFGDGSAKPVWNGPVQMPVGEETVAAATYYLAVTLTAGTLSYRMEQ